MFGHSVTMSVAGFRLQANIATVCLIVVITTHIFLVLTLRVLTNWGTFKSRVSETPKRPKDSP